MSSTTRPSSTELSRLSEEFETSPPGQILEWADRQFGSALVFTASFEDAVLVHLVARHAPTAQIVLLDTQYLFAETLWFANELRLRYNLDLHIEHPAPDVRPDNRWQIDVETCCNARKVEPLQRVLKDTQGWITGLRRADGPSRATTPIVSYDVARDVVKINPIVTWSDEQLDAFQAEHHLLRNPLTERGYASIGCWPCTRPVAPGEDRRAGRWSGQQKTECGLHS